MKLAQWQQWLGLGLMTAGVLMLPACEGGGGSNSDSDTDTTSTNTEEVVLAPALLSPANGAVMDNAATVVVPGSDTLTWVFVWGSVAGATDYHLEVYRAGAATLVNINTAEITHTHTTAGYIPVTELSNWRWHVQAQVGGAWQEWSSERSFTVEPPDSD